MVVGLAPAGQARRAFLYYLERERPRPYQPFLHYNSWYDIAWSPFALNETNCLEAVRLFGERFIQVGKRAQGLIEMMQARPARNLTAPLAPADFATMTQGGRYLATDSFTREQVAEVLAGFSRSVKRVFIRNTLRFFVRHPLVLVRLRGTRW